MGKEKEGFWEKALDYTQAALDVVGMIPVVGEVADLANAGISLGRGNYLEAAISFVSMIPGIGAAGPLMKALNKLPPSVLKNLDKFLEALGDILKKLDLKKILDGASGILDKLLNFITKKNDKLGKGLRKIFCEKLGWACFAARTLVYSKQGYMPIEEIKVGDLVYAKDPVTGAQGLKEVRQVFERKVRKLIHIELEEASLSSTLEHPFWVYGKGFIKAEDLEVGDALVRYEAYESTTFKTEKIKSIEISYHEDPVTVYNFEVEAWHSYFVSEQGIWVHNAKCQAPKQKGKVATKKGNLKREPPKIKRDKDGKIVKKKGKLERPTKGAGKTVFSKGKNVLDNFNVDNAYVKPKHLYTTGGSGQKFLGSSKLDAEEILRDVIKNGTVKSITDNGLTKAGNASYEIILDAGKTIGTRGETLVKIVLSEDGGMLSAYPVK